MNRNFKYTILFFTSLLMFSTEISAKTSPSFDCNKASTEVERLICSDDKLAKLDVEMNNSYHAFMKTLDDDFYRDKLKTKQQDWLSYRGKLSCMNTNNKYKINCLKRAYQTRIDNLTAWTKRENYDFFRDCYEYSDTYVRKFISRDGKEYYVTPQCQIYPELPKHEKIYCKKGRNTRLWATRMAYFWQSEHRILIGATYGENDSIEGKDKYKIENFPDEITAYPPKNIDEAALFNEFKEYLKKIDIEQNVNDCAYIDTPKRKCIDFLTALKEDAKQIMLMPTIRAVTPEEMIDKIPLHCTREQYEKLVLYPKYPLRKSILAFNLVYLPISENMGILGGERLEKESQIGGSSPFSFRMINPQTCEVNKTYSHGGGHLYTFIGKQGSEYLIISKYNRGKNCKWVLNPISNISNDIYCNF